MKQRKKIVILGSTGSIGINALNVMRQLPDHFVVTALATYHNVDLLLRQARAFNCNSVAIAAPDLNIRETDFTDLGITVFSGPKSLVQLIESVECDLLVNSVVGAAGFLPALRAMELEKDVALANKESLVVGGELITRLAKKNGCQLLPIDSEHSAIFQSLVGEDDRAIEKIILTASGGPFRTLPLSEFRNITVEQALKHPNWNMGSKITIDSATMMNKGLEIIEAHWLFNVDYDRIQVVIHPQSIIHSMVSFVDGSIKAQLGLPDMRVPIQYALTYPDRQPSSFPRLAFDDLLDLHFEPPDLKKFRPLALASQAGQTGGTAPAVMNAANEVAVSLFLRRRISFLEISDLIERALDFFPVISGPEAEEFLDADQRTRAFVLQQVR